MKKTLLITSLALLTAVHAQEGKQLYQTYCAACHGVNGQGTKGAAPPLEQSLWINGNPDTITKILLYGLQGPLTIHGESYDLVMPPQTTLNDKQIVDVINYVRNEWGNKGTHVDEKFIKQTRDANKEQVGLLHTTPITRQLARSSKPVKIKNLICETYPYVDDIDDLKKHRPDTVEEEKIGAIDPLQGGPVKKAFSAKWIGLLKINKPGEYTFSLGANSHARVMIEGKTLINLATDSQPIAETIKLPKGQQEIEVFYTHKAKADLSLKLFWSGPDFNMRPLHNLKKAKKAPSIKINPADQRPLVHRNFFDKTGERSLAVGFPKDINFIFSTKEMGLKSIWRGEFLEVGKTWNGRARGEIATPLANTSPITTGEIFKKFSDKPSSWRDKDNQQLVRQFKGYKFDPQGNLIFLYTIGGLNFEDHFSTSPEGKSLKREIKITHNQAAVNKQQSNIYLKLLENASSSGNNTYKSKGKIQLTVTNSKSKPILLKKDVALLVSQPSTITLEYVWKK